MVYGEVMDDDLLNIPLHDVKSELRRGIVECQKRGLVQTVKWLSELNYGLSDIDIDSMEVKSQDLADLGCGAGLEGVAPSERDSYFLSKSYFDLREYDRAAYFVRSCESPVPRFLHLYATYMAREKRRLDSTTDHSNLSDSSVVGEMSDLLAILRTEYSKSRLDGYGMYLYGIVLKALNLNQLASEVLMHAIRTTPMLWAAYVELAPLISDKEKIFSLHFGGHWMRHFFVAHTYIELYLNDEALKAYEELQMSGFRNCVYVTAQMAQAYHNKRDVEKAIEVFQRLQETDPYRLDNMDSYSNLLFVRELKTEMAQLAHKAVTINKYSPETCCVIGNYYSIRCDHQMAIMYFQRALKLNPKYLSAWTLMGHEFMELKNTNAAIQSYRKAVEVNKRDYRAWYGLGQSYEILKMHYYSLYYFKISHHLRPYDSRMLVALGETYEKLEKCDNAVKCYWKACDVGDIEGIAMYKLANLHEKLGEIDIAVQCYVMYCDDERATTDKQSLCHAFMTLANYYESKSEFDHAAHYAYKCLESDDRKSEAKSLLKTIENKRAGKHNLLAESAEKAAAVATADTSDDDMEMEMTGFDIKTLKISRSNRRRPRNVPSTSAETSATRTTAGDARSDSDLQLSNVTALSSSAEISNTQADATVDDDDVDNDNDNDNDNAGEEDMDISTISID